MARPSRLLLVLALIFVAASRGSPPESPPLTFLELPVWDLSDDGLPFRAGVLLPAGHDPLSRAAGLRPPRWVLAAGYATLPDLYDDGTGRLSGWGGDAWFAGFAREWAWEVPGLERDGAFVAVVLDLGLNYASASIPSNGTNFNFIVSPGLSWERPRATGATWHVGLRWFHLSNANLRERNAGYDGLTLRLGARW